MLNEEKIKEYAENWAMDLDKKSLQVVEITNTDVINQSIETILSTPLGTRLFNIGFGSDFSLRIFDNMDISYLEQMVADTITAIEYWEDRIQIIRDKVVLQADADRHILYLRIPYIVKERQIMGEFSKYIRE